MMIMGSSKNHTKNKWCFMLCFRPIKEEPLKLIRGSQESRLHQKFLFAFSNDRKPDSCPDDKEVSKSPRRRFPRVIKAFFSSSTSSLPRKKRNKKSGKDISRLSSNISSKFQKIFDTSNEKKSKSILSSSHKDLSDRASSRSSLFSSSTLGSSMRSSSSSSSSSISSMVSNSRTGSGRRQTSPVDLKEWKPKRPISLPKKKKEGGTFKSDVGLYFVLICLVGLIFLGKVFAIFCTSSCLFLVPPLSKEAPSEENNVSSIDVDSDGYKKKVIMEGLLERNRTCKL